MKGSENRTKGKENPRFSTFNQSVILPSIKAINKHSDIFVEIGRIGKIKSGRRVDALRFPIESKTKSQIDTIRNVKRPVQQDLFSHQKTENKEIKNQANVVVLFGEFQEVVVATFGVTPVSFMKLLSTGEYDKKKIKQAISVTRRAKYNQEIKKNVAGYFLRALQDGYTDAKEEQKKKELKVKNEKAKNAANKKQIIALKTKRTKAINDRIREVVADFPDITLEAIESIKNTAMTKIMIEKKEFDLGRPLDVDDYRSDKILRDFVKGKIMELKPASFKEIENNFERKMLELKGIK